MKRALLGLLALSACNLKNLDGNDPDGGACPALTAPAGSGTTSGFPVGASYQTTSQWVSDAGVTGALLSISLYQGGVLCHGGGDAGVTNFATFFVDFPHVDRASIGTFPRESSDGGASFTGLVELDGGLLVAADGTLTIATLQNCALTGSFNLQLSQGADAGATTPFSGTFNSTYCRKN